MSVNVAISIIVITAIERIKKDGLPKVHCEIPEEDITDYSSELYDDYMSVVDATDKKKQKEMRSINYYNSEKRWNKSR